MYNRFISHLNNIELEELTHLYTITYDDFDGTGLYNGFDISDDGTIMYISGRFKTCDYLLGTPYDLRTRGSASTYHLYSSNSLVGDSLTFVDSGDKILTSSPTTYPYVTITNVNTSYDLSGLGTPQHSAILSEFYQYVGVYSTMSDDGTRMMAVGINTSYTGVTMATYSLSTPYDLSTLSLISTRNAPAPYIMYPFVEPSKISGYVSAYKMDLTANYTLTGASLKSMHSYLTLVNNDTIHGVKVFDSGTKVAFIIINSDTEVRQIQVYQIN